VHSPAATGAFHSFAEDDLFEFFPDLLFIGNLR